MSKSARGVYAADGKSYLSPEQIAAYGVAQGVYLPKDLPALLAFARTDPGGALTAVCRAMTAARPVTRATPATPGSGPSVAADSSVPTYPVSWTGRVTAAAQKVTSASGSEYPRALATAVTAARRASGLRVGARKDRAPSAVRAQGPVHDVTETPALLAAASVKAQQAMRESQQASLGYDDRSVPPSTAAAEQQARYEREVTAMHAEQKARGIG